MVSCHNYGTLLGPDNLMQGTCSFSQNLADLNSLLGLRITLFWGLYWEALNPKPQTPKP